MSQTANTAPAINSDERRHQIWAIVITAAIAALTTAGLFFANLHYKFPPDDPEEYQKFLEEDSIMYLDNFELPTQFGDTPEAATEDTENESEPSEQEEVEEPQPPVPDVVEPENKGEVKPKSKPQVTAKEPSPQKVKEQPKDNKETGAAKKNDKKTDKPASKPEPKPTPKQEKSQASKDVENAFGGKGKQGSPAGNSPTGQLSGAPSIGGGELSGYTWEYWAREAQLYSGTITVEVTVNARGEITSAKATGGSGKLWGDQQSRRNVEALARKLRFRVPKGTTATAHGTVTYRVK